MTKIVESHLHATVFHGFGRFRGATYCGTWNALDQPECTLLEVLLIDLDDSVAYANSLEYISENGFHDVDSTILTIAIACHLPGGSSQASTLWKDDLDRISRCVPTLYANSQAQFDVIRFRLALLGTALQGETLQGLHFATLKAILGSNGMLHTFSGWGVGTERIGSAWRMAMREATSLGCDVLQANRVLAIITGQMGDIRVKESQVLEQKILQHCCADCWCEVATSFGMVEQGQIAATLFLR